MKENEGEGDGERRRRRKARRNDLLILACLSSVFHPSSVLCGSLVQQPAPFDAGRFDVCCGAEVLQMPAFFFKKKRWLVHGALRAESFCMRGVRLPVKMMLSCWCGLFAWCLPGL